MTDEQLWAELCAAENAFYQARMALLRNARDLPAILGKALALPSQRGAALRLLEILPEEQARAHLASLVDLASVGHSDVGLTRSVLLRIDRTWLVAHIDPLVKRILEHGGEEEYRRIAELYRLLDAALLDKHLKRSALHPDEEVREVAAEFASEKG